MSGQNPVIVVPGITASQLRDEYPISPEVVWSAMLKKSYDRVALHPDNVRYERDEPARVVADQAFDLPYGELVEELRHDLTQHEDRPTPVYPFAYDWRQPLEHSEALLAAFVDEVIERTKLIPHYYRAGYAESPRVDLIGHSMGGLIITGYLQRHRAAARVAKVVTLGTPFRGSLEAPLKITTGLAALGTVGASSREREVARLTPALYYLLPSYAGAVTVDAGLSNDLFKPRAWQTGVVATLAEYIRLHGRDKARNKAERTKQAQRLFTRLLDQAHEHRERLESFNPGQAGLTDDDWLCVVGVGHETRTQMHINKVRNEPEFVLTSDDRLNRLTSSDPVERRKTGDGTLPYLGACGAFIPVEKLVCVTPGDFGFWEVGDRFFEGTVGLHGMLPKMNLIHRLIVSHLTGKSRPGTWGRAAPDLPADKKWAPPITGLQQKI